MAVHRELAFEIAIEDHLLANGWVKSDPKDYDKALALNPKELFAFIDETQPKEWARLVERHGGDAGVTRSKFLTRLTSDVGARGTADVLRKGVTDLGILIRVAVFRPAHQITPEVQAQYAANRASITRQLAYTDAAHLTLDVMLALNGMPVATAELKNPLTHQTVEHAKTQYRKDRDSRELLFADRTLVHFAVDPDEVYLTTKLAGEATEFVPFNRGDGGSKGNPPNQHGYRTEYLWTAVWQRDAWLDILARFVESHEVVDPKTKRRGRHVIFPRYHQWEAVRAIVADARLRGAGQRYLIEHSAGSGKSNTIAWTAHRLSNLYDDKNRKLFDKVVVVTDRVNLDQQLQGTVKQFEQVVGVVKKIDESAKQLQDALSDPGTQIVVTTLQKFPVLVDRAFALPPGRYAILIDEAHSSQSGDAAHALKVILGHGSEEAALAAAERDDERDAEESDTDEGVLKAVAARGLQPNLTYVAFTATPKARTLELFGTKNAEGKVAPFHLYSMRQAIAEGFILDVLRTYVTYATYYKVAKAVADNDPLVDRARAAQAIARFVSLHATNFAQKAEVIVEHVRRDTIKKINGRGKAMVVTRSRLHAIRIKQAIDRYISEKGYDLRACIAFSGTVEADGLKYTETQMNNGIPLKQLPKEFVAIEPEPGQPGRFRERFQLLVVAEKYQTGYDEPLLQSMFVDKLLGGLKAVQTLSRLNRSHPAKNDTFVLDFVNTAAEIQEAFKPYYEATVAEPTDPNLLFTVRDRVLAFDVIDQAEVVAFARALAGAGRDAHAKLYGHTDAALERYRALERADQTDFRQTLHAYARLYAFLAQIVPFADLDLERLYVYVKALLGRLPEEREAAIDLGDQVTLTHLRTELTGKHTLSLAAGEGELTAFPGGGRGLQHEATRSPLSEVIDLLNARFGTNFDASDALYFEQMLEEMLADEDLVGEARANSVDNFLFGFGRAFDGRVIERRELNEQIFARVMEDKDFSAVLKDLLGKRMYEMVRAKNGKKGS